VSHIVLLGDSIFDNGAYVGHEPDVASHLASMLPGGWRATLLAVDGATTRGLDGQAARVPSDATHLVVSVGGNDALRHQDLLSTPVNSTAEALALFGARVEGFEADYRRAVKPLFGREVSVVLCTIYNGNLDRREAGIAKVALALFNDAIVRTALEHQALLIDLRLVCTQPPDYANPIEPSGAGGRKIAQAIARACLPLPPRPSSPNVPRG